MTKGGGQGDLKRKNYWPQVSVDQNTGICIYVRNMVKNF